MRILYFHQYFTTPQGAGGNRSYWLAMALKNAGHDVHMVCANSPDGNTGLTQAFHKRKRQGTVDGIRVTEFKLDYSNHLDFIQRSFIFFRFALHSVKIAATDDYDLIFCSSTPLTASIPGIVARWLRRKRFVLEIRDLWPELPKAMGVITNPLVLGAISALEWISYRSAHACIGLSPGIVDGIRKRSHASLKTTMLPNGCDLGIFNTAVTVTPQIEGIEEGDFVAIFIGAHGIANGLDAVLDAANYLKSQNIDNIKFLFLGSGKLKPELIARKERDQLANCIFLPPVAKDQLDGYMKRADAGLMVLKNVPAFYYGTSPNKFFDYLTAGKPIVNNYPGWLADIISEHDLGIAVPPESPAKFANALLDLANDPDRTQAMSRNTRAVAENQFNRDVIASEFVEFLETLASPDYKRG